jgi:sialic acid synthase SpsE
MVDNVKTFRLDNRDIGPQQQPLVIAEMGINHEGSFHKAARMIRDAALAGAECVKLQTHVIEDEMIYNKVIPGNANESIWDIMSRCALTENDERRLKELAENLGLIFLSTPFSRAGADRLEELGVVGYKIGSGECNNYPLVKHIASFGKPVILSTGMNDIESIRPSVAIFRKRKVPYALLQCTSVYPTPYDRVMLNGITELQRCFPETVIGLSDHSIGNYTCFAAVALGASILEKHFTSEKAWKGPDIPISIDPWELKDLIQGSKAVYHALGGEKRILSEEEPTIKFAYASVVTIRDVGKGESFDLNNLWVKRPGTGDFLARELENLIGKKASIGIPANTQLKREMVQ